MFKLLFIEESKPLIISLLILHLNRVYIIDISRVNEYNYNY